MTTKFGDVRYYIQRSSWRALQALKDASTYNQSVLRMTIREEREQLFEDGFIGADSRLTPRGETLGNFLRSNPDWRPEAPASGGVDAVAVKALEWIDDGKHSRADAGFEIKYSVFQREDGFFDAVLLGTAIGHGYLSAITAKEACQADYEQRIRSALSSAATPSLVMPSREWMRDKIESDPDIADCGTVPVAPSVSEAGGEACQHCGGTGKWTMLGGVHQLDTVEACNHCDGPFVKPTSAGVESKQVDWVTWEGGACPVPPETRVTYICRGSAVTGNLNVHRAKAGELRWQHSGERDDIVLYYVAPAEIPAIRI